MVEEIMKAYHVAYERDASGCWVASVREVRGCHTQGRTVDEARRRIRKAMDLFVDDARSAKLIDNVKLPVRELSLPAVSPYDLRQARRALGFALRHRPPPGGRVVVESGQAAF